YSGDSSFLSSSGTLSGGQVVNRPAPVATMTSVSSLHNPSVFGQSVSFTAIVTPQSGSGTPTGTIQFVIDGSNFGNPVVLSGGTASSNGTSSLSVAGHTITAMYSGDGNFNGSTGGIIQTVNAANTSLALSSSANPSLFGQSITLTAAVSATPPGAGM